LFAYGIFKVIYAPHKAFREIIQNPRYIGPILIMILFTVANAGFGYTLISKTYVEQTLPASEQPGTWTENSALWTNYPGVNSTENYDDYINGTYFGSKAYYGNKSIEFSAADSTRISMQLDNIGPINCLGSEGYKNLSLRIKWISPEVKPENVTIYLFSTASDYFYSNLKQEFANSASNFWNNLTISLKPSTWVLYGSNASWGNINGLKLDFVWLNNSNITLLVDGLFFRGIFKSQMLDVSSFLLSFVPQSFMQFFIQWVLLGGMIYIMTKAFRAKTVWKAMLILAGFALITMFIQALVYAAAFSTLPELYYPLEIIGGVKGEGDIASNKILEATWLVSDIYRYVQIGVFVWTILLCAIATRLSAEFSWTKSFLVSATAYFATITVVGLILGY